MTTGLSRRKFLQTCGLGAAGLGLSGLVNSRGAKAASSSQPNVLFIIEDQLRYPAWFLPTNRLPGLTRLRNEGVWFTNHFSCAAPCSPSRATIQTGLHITNHGIHGNVAYDSGTGGLPTSYRTLGHRFQAGGYRTPYFGKWHLTTASMLKTLGNDLSAYGYEEWSPPDYVTREPDGIYNDPTIAGQAGTWLEKHGTKGPWFMTCSLLNPHDIEYCALKCADKSVIPHWVSELPPNFTDSLSGKPGAQMAYRKGQASTNGIGADSTTQEWLDFMNSYCYYAQAVDQQVAALLETLDTLGLANNTLVIFTSDHGEMGGSHQLIGKGPFVYQECAKVPLALRWTGRLHAGQELSALSHSVDIVPTLAAMAGLAAPSNLKGKSLNPLLSYISQDATTTSAAADDEQGQGRASADSVHSYVLMAYGGAQSAASAAGTPPRQIRALYNGRYKYAQYFDSGVEDQLELYDLQSDPYELTNLTDDSSYSDVKASMKSLLTQARRVDFAENV